MLTLRFNHPIIITCCALAMAAASALAQEVAPLTAAEQAEVERTIINVEVQCQAGLEDMRQEDAAAAAAAKDPISAKLNSRYLSGGYCGCISQRFKAGMTPGLLRKGSPGEVQQLLRGAASHCAVKSFQAFFPELCRTMLGEAPANAAAPKVTGLQMEAACGCLQADVNQIAGDALAATVRATVGDYNRWRLAPDEPVAGSPGSLIHSVKRCMQDAGINRK